ncbi:radical SAM/SPASM domain-containing protein [Mucilaginibacter jinjuensis]|uniref:Radical SAM protein n=1 Tax=Mucilaginibacter jinjuensis TaxID=1176721 RepID=A0ABY7TD22_9SPHI|nr:radical SAM protein [Mucilaginibacter jinjuensis]WCT14356.1 radical SAM protein [Mucilaginibacter jinjuensis]
MKFKLSQYIHLCTDDDILPSSSLLYSTRSGALLEISNKDIECMKRGEFDALSEKMRKKLIQFEVLVPHAENELLSVLNYNKSQTKDERSLSFTIQPSGNCQLGCHYCGQVHTKKVMKDEVADRMYNRIKEKVINRTGAVESIDITWYGGEPLTGLSSIEHNSKRLISLAEDYNLKYSASIVTNGLILKEELFKKFVLDYKVMNYQITIDGTGEFHDKRRMLKSGNPSFDIIFKNVVTIVNSEFYQSSKAKIAIRCNVDAENKDNVFELIDLLRTNNVLNKVNFYISPIHDWGDNNASKINGISKEEFAQLEIDVFMELLKDGLNANDLVPQRKTYACMVVSETSEVFDAFGNVSTCWEIPLTPSFENTPYISGNLLVDPDIDTTKVLMRDWYNEIPTNETWCKSCKFLPVCAGSCPKEWYSNNPACPSFKFNIDDRLFLSKLQQYEQSVL